MLAIMSAIFFFFFSSLPVREREKEKIYNTYIINIVRPRTCLTIRPRDKFKKKAKKCDKFTKLGCKSASLHGNIAPIAKKFYFIKYTITMQ